ncbi:BglG family transcription antiterminator [Diplocloster hominis]|uniref:BglG family transcription antiterminator n=1 Tax=Diplocloster hominis TaxID=3079010 RepID=UPI0031BADC15
MNLTTRQQRLLKHFVSRQTALSYPEIANAYSISISTARNDMRFISNYLDDQYQISFHRDSSNRFFLEKEDIRTLLKAHLPFSLSTDPNIKSRLLLLIYHLLFSPPQTLSMQRLADLLFISRPTAYHLLNTAENVLAEYQITIQKGSPNGLALTCREYAWRTAAATLYQQLKKHGYQISSSRIKASPVSSMDVVSVEILEGLFPGLDICKIKNMLLRFEKEQGVRLIDYSFERVCVYLAISMYRVRQHHLVEYPESFSESGFEPTPAYALSQEFIELLEDNFHIKLPPQESHFISSLFLCSNLEYLNADYRYSIVTPLLRDFLDELLERTSNMLNRRIASDRKLYDDLVHYIPSAVGRLRYRFSSCKGPYDTIRKQYSRLFAIIWSTNLLFNHYFHVELNKEESCCLVLFFAAALERTANHLRAIAAWKSDTGLGEIALLNAVIEKNIPNLSLIDVLPLHQLDMKPYHRSAYDFVISNCPVTHSGKTVIQVNSILTPDDIDTVQKVMLEITERENQNTRTRAAMHYLLHPSGILTGVHPSHKNEILKKLCTLLETSGKVTEAFYDTVLSRESICSTYIGNGLVFTHGDSEQVHRSALSIARLASPISWDDAEVDLIFVYAFNLEDLERNNIKMDDFFSIFVDITNEDDMMNELREQPGPEAFYETFLSFF